MLNLYSDINSAPLDSPGTHRVGLFLYTFVHFLQQLYQFIRCGIEFLKLKLVDEKNR